MDQYPVVYLNNEEQRQLKELEEQMEYARRKIDQIGMGIVTVFDKEYYEDSYFDSLNRHNAITGKPLKTRELLGKG